MPEARKRVSLFAPGVAGNPLEYVRGLNEAYAAMFLCHSQLEDNALRRGMELHLTEAEAWSASSQAHTNVAVPVNSMDLDLVRVS